MQRHKHAAEQGRQSMPVPDKLFYKIGEVSRIAGVESYVLRYWETEFPMLKPRKNKSGQRVYVKKDLETILQIKKMLYQDRFTIEGVRKKLGHGTLAAVPDAAPVAEQRQKAAPRAEQSGSPQILDLVKKRLRDLLVSLK